MKSFQEDYREILRLFGQYLKQEQEQGRQEIMAVRIGRTGPSAPTRGVGDDRRVIPDKENKLEQLRRECSSCRRCGLAKTRKNLVFGQGNLSARVVFVGEAPGEEEDKRGIPFVGRAGELFNKMLAAINLKREEIYITNILKCRPPHNRNPLPEEINLCLPWLTEQLKIIKPKIICTLGRIAAQTLLQTADSLSGRHSGRPLRRDKPLCLSLSVLRGKVKNYNDAEVIVTYHPAALLRNVAYKRPAWEDLKLLKKELKKYG